MPLSDSIASTTSFCGLWTVLSGCPGARNATVDNALGYVDLGDLDVTEVESALRTACDRLDAPELFGPDDVTLRDSARFTSKSTMMGSVPLRPAEIRMAWVLRNCERYVFERGELCLSWLLPFPNEPMRSIAALAHFLDSHADRWSNLESRSSTTALPDANEEWRVLDNVLQTLAWFQRRELIRSVPSVPTLRRTRINAGRCAEMLRQALRELLQCDGSLPTTEGGQCEPRDPICSVVLRGKAVGPLVLDREVSPVTSTQYDVLQALVNAGEDGLSLRELIRCSGHGSARNVLKNLADSSSKWQQVVLLAGAPGRRYRLLFQ